MKRREGFKGMETKKRKGEFVGRELLNTLANRVISYNSGRRVCQIYQADDPTIGCFEHRWILWRTNADPRNRLHARMVLEDDLQGSSDTYFSIRSLKYILSTEMDRSENYIIVFHDRDAMLPVKLSPCYGDYIQDVTFFVEFRAMRTGDYIMYRGLTPSEILHAGECEREKRVQEWHQKFDDLIAHIWETVGGAE